MGDGDGERVYEGGCVRVSKGWEGIWEGKLGYYEGVFNMEG